MNDYNGWTNRDTWLVNLWLDNDLGSYQAKCAALLARSEPVTVGAAKIIALDLCVSDLIARDGGKLTKVNWREIAESWEGERLELIAYSS